MIVAGVIGAVGEHVKPVACWPVRLNPDTVYGFDVACEENGSAEFWEISGVAANAYSGGSAYMSGVSGYGNNSMTTYSGDRTFMIELSANEPSVGPCLMLSTPALGPVILSWPVSYGDEFNVLTNADLTDTNGWGTANWIPSLSGDHYVITNQIG